MTKLSNDEFQKLSLKLEGERELLRSLRAEFDDVERRLKHAQANVRVTEIKMFGASSI